MAHRAERIRKRANRQLDYFRQQAERYSSRINQLYNEAIEAHYVIRDPELINYFRLEDIDCTHFYDQMIREAHR